MKTALYMRVSTMEQANEGYSLQSQKRKLIAYCEAMNWQVYKIYSDEGISGSNLEKRPAAIQMLEDIKSGVIENVLIMKVDRLCRNTKDLLEIVDLLKKHNVRLNAVDEKIDYTTDVGKMVLTLLGSFAEFERNRITARMNDGRTQKKINGIKSLSGKVLYGYKYVNNKFVVNPLEASGVKFIFESVLEHKSLRYIAKTIAYSKEYNCCNRIWTPAEIKSILKNPTYKGYTTIKNNNNVTYYKANNVEPIVSTDLWEKANVIISARSNNNTYKANADDYAFGDVAYCGKCGNKYNTRTIVDPNGKYKTQYYYRCMTNIKRYSQNPDEIKRCTKSCRSNARFENDFLNYFDNLVIQPAKPNNEEIVINNEQLKTDIEYKIKLLENKRISLSKKFVDDLITPEMYSTLNNEYNQEYDSLKNQLKNLDNKKSAIIENIDYDTLLKFKMNLREMWEIMTKSEKRNFITLHFEKIYFTEDGVTKVIFRKAN